LHRNEYADLYLRLSIDREGKDAIDRQEKDCRAWAEVHGVSVRAVHIDRGRSAYDKKVERAGFDAACAAVASGVVGTLIVWKLDRLSRQGMQQVGLFLDDLVQFGGRLVSVKDGLDSSHDEARSMIAALSEHARVESTNIGLRVRSKKESQRCEGRWIGGVPPYGLVSRDGRLYVDPQSGRVLREVARRVLAGSSLTKVTVWFARSRVRGRAGSLPFGASV